MIPRSTVCAESQKGTPSASAIELQKALEWRFLGPISATNDVVTPFDACNVVLVDLRVSCRQISHILEK